MMSLRPLIIGKCKIAPRLIAAQIKYIGVAIMCYVLSISLVLAPAFTVYAQGNNIVIDSNAHASGSAPSLGPQSGGVDVLNIAAPSAAGVSHNKFTDFNVLEHGLIVNNQNMQEYSPNTTSVLSGQHVEFNRNLGTGSSARIILNEVTGNSVSSLKGYTEIYGRQADYILANPNGIAIAGAGFINVGRLSMIAGTPNMQNGAIKDFDIIPGGIIKIDGVGEYHFGLHAKASKAELVADLIDIAGNVYADGELSLLTGNDRFNYATGSVSSTNSPLTGVAIDSSALGGMRAGSIKIHASQTGLGINVDSSLVASTANIEITADGNIVFKDAAAQGAVNVASSGGDVATSAGGIVYADTVSLSAGANVENNAEVIANRTLAVQAEEIKNTGKLTSQGLGEYAALNVHNYGQIYSGSALDFDVAGDFINYRDSAVLSGGDIDFKVGRNLVNYRAEIFALGDIRFGGQEGNLASLTAGDKAFELDEDLAAKYDNPYVEDQLNLAEYTGQEQDTGFEDEEEDGDYELYLTELDRALTFSGDAFTDDAEPGTSYLHGDGFVIILGVPGQDENGDPILDENNEIVYVLPQDEDTLPFTILDVQGQLVAYTALDDGPDGQDESIHIGGGTEEAQNGNLDPYTSRAPYSAKSDTMNVLANIGGRIEAFGNIGVNSDRLINAGLHFNTGTDAASVYYHFVRNEAATNAGWQELGRYKIDQTYLDSIPGYMLAGGDMGIHARSVLNQSAHLAAGNNMSIAAEELTNQTYSEIFRLAISLQQRKKWKNWYGKTKRSTSWGTQYYNERVYSHTPALISSMGDMFISATSIFNDQLEGVEGFRFGRDPGSDTLGSLINTKFNLPTGVNGLFKMAGPDSKYLVESNTSLLNPGWYLGGEYLFSNIRHDNESYKLLGDPAYETRVIMDTLRNVTGGRYLDGEDVLTDYQRMQALYNGSISEHERLSLQVGVALTAEQVALLQSDIIWYVEQEIDGQKVLVPQLYLCPSTLFALSSDNFAAKISGGNVEIIAEYVSNSGDIFAANLLSMKADTLINESNWMNQASIRGDGATVIEAGLLHNAGGSISGGVTQITADNMVNETKVYQEIFRKDVTQNIGHTGVISGDSGLKIDVDGALLNRGATLASGGDMYLSADTMIFDTVEVYNRTVLEQTSSGFLSKKKKTTIDESLVNVGSNILAAGDVKITTGGDATFRGATLESGGDTLFNIGGSLNLLAARDSASHYSKTSKSSWGGLKKEIDIKFNENTMLAGTVVNTLDGLNIITGRDVNVIGSDINAGGDANILAGYRLTETGLEKSGLGGSVNVINDFEEVKAYSFHKKTDYTKGFKDILTGDLSNIDLSFSGGKFQASLEIGSSEATTNDINQKNVASSNITAGGNLTIGADGDINVAASNIMAGGDALFDAKNINLLSEYSVEDTKFIHELTTISTTATVGNAYVDAALAVKALVDATKAVKDAKDELSKMKDLRDQGKASDAAVKDAELNLAMSIANEVNALITLGMAAAGAAAAGSSGMGTGLYASAGLAYESSKTTTTMQSNTSVGSNVVASGDIIFNASGDMAQIGSNVLSEEANIYYKIGQDLLIAAADNTYSSRSKTESESLSVSVGNNGVASGSFGTSSGKSSSHSWPPETRQHVKMESRRQGVIHEQADQVFSGVQGQGGQRGY